MVNFGKCKSSSEHDEDESEAFFGDSVAIVLI